MRSGTRRPIRCPTLGTIGSAILASGATGRSSPTAGAVVTVDHPVYTPYPGLGPGGLSIPPCSVTSLAFTLPAANSLRLGAYFPASANSLGTKLSATCDLPCDDGTRATLAARDEGRHGPLGLSSFVTRLQPLPGAPPGRRASVTQPSAGPG